MDAELVTHLAKLEHTQWVERMQRVLEDSQREAFEDLLVPWDRLNDEQREAAEHQAREVIDAIDRGRDDRYPLHEPSGPLSRLPLEWQNAHAEEMRHIKEAHERLAGVSWGEVAARVRLGELEARRDNPDFIAAVLFLLDQRPVSVLKLQKLLRVKGNHLYRFLQRAGVEWEASTSRPAKEQQDDVGPWSGEYYLSPIMNKAIVRGNVVKVKKGQNLMDRLASPGT